MPWAYEINPQLQIVEVVYEGEITARDLRESTSEFIALEKKKGMNRFLVETTRIKLASSLIDLYNLPSKQYLDEEADRLGRVAIVLPTCPKTKEAIRFYETVCRNRGWMVRAFLERKEALNWLT